MDKSAHIAILDAGGRRSGSDPARQLALAIYHLVEETIVAKNANSKLAESASGQVAHSSFPHREVDGDPEWLSYDKGDVPYSDNQAMWDNGKCGEYMHT